MDRSLLEVNDEKCSRIRIIINVTTTTSIGFKKVIRSFFLRWR
ncbi:hypothetical protein LC048_10575 [Mesobacillus subterraneus]|nr:hypothetical protein [Mesobacillus subterraneus]WLR57259.1 hypothetical protein LC048_10575 [Mesobacillus subterraneus]